MRIYEEYDNPREKRRAQRGAVRGQATGQARGYLLVFDEDGSWISHHTTGPVAVYDGLGELYDGAQPGDPPRSIVHVTPARGFLASHCRLVGFDSLPEKWKRAFAARLDDILVEANDPGCRRRYARVLRHAT